MSCSVKWPVQSLFGGEGGWECKVIVIEQPCEGVWLLVWELYGGARRWEAGCRCADVFVKPCCFLTQDPCHPRHLSQPTPPLCSTTAPSLSLSFTLFICSQLISALSNRVTHCTPLYVFLICNQYWKVADYCANATMTVTLKLVIPDQVML